MAVSVAAWVNTDSPRVTSDDREFVARPSVWLAALALHPGTVRGRVVPLVRVHRPVRVLLQAAHASRLPNQMETDTLALIYAAFLENMGR